MDWLKYSDFFTARPGVDIFVYFIEIVEIIITIVVKCCIDLRLNPTTFVDFFPFSLPPNIRSKLEIKLVKYLNVDWIKISY